MKNAIAELITLTSNLRDRKGPKSAYPDCIKKLSVDLAKTIQIKEIAKQTGIAKTSIYKWKREKYSLSSHAVPSKKTKPRPLVLQEVSLPHSASSPPKHNAITMTSASGVTVHLPVDDKTISMVINRLMGEV